LVAAGDRTQEAMLADDNSSGMAVQSTKQAIMAQCSSVSVAGTKESERSVLPRPKENLHEQSLMEAARRIRTLLGRCTVALHGNADRRKWMLEVRTDGRRSIMIRQDTVVMLSSKQDLWADNREGSLEAGICWLRDCRLELGAAA